MREGAHQGWKTPYPAQLVFTGATSAAVVSRTHGFRIHRPPWYVPRTTG